MTWTIAKKSAGYVVRVDRDIELVPFDVLVFLDVATPTLMSALRQQLPGTKGYFQIEGQIPSVLKHAIEDELDLTVRLDTRGAKLEAAIDIQGQVQTVLPPGKTGTDTSQQYDFIVKSDVYVTDATDA